MTELQAPHVGLQTVGPEATIAAAGEVSYFPLNHKRRVVIMRFKGAKQTWPKTRWRPKPRTHFVWLCVAECWALKGRTWRLEWISCAVIGTGCYSKVKKVYKSLMRKRIYAVKSAHAGK